MYGSALASKFVNCLMWDGKKSIALRVFYDALDLIEKRVTDAEPIEVFTQADEADASELLSREEEKIRESVTYARNVLGIT